MSREAWVVCDLGFGDAGKGATVDFLVRERGAGTVVRFNGGAQAGHRVVAPDGRAHVFSQLGAGSFVPGVRTHLGPACVLHPGGLRVEAARLADAGVDDALARLSIDRRALLVSPFQQAAGRLRELLRGPARHGTCGVGIGEAVADALAGRDDVLRAAHLERPGALLEALQRQQQRKRRELAAAATLAADDPRADSEWALLCDPGAAARVLDAWSTLPGEAQLLDPDRAAAALDACEVLVFEGAQGVLLDQDWGLHPHTTWSDCTPRGALLLLAGGRARRVTRLGVLRAYATRHGEGPFPTHDPEHDAALPEPVDEPGWQGPLRRGPLDLVLLRYALEVCGGVDGLALTCLDRVGQEVPLCGGYTLDAPPDLAPPDPDGVVRRLPPRAPPDLAHQERLGRLLRAARPVLQRIPRADLPEALAAALGTPVWLEARGPSAADRRWRRPPT